MARFTRRGFTVVDVAGAIVGLTLLATASGMLVEPGKGDDSHNGLTRLGAESRKMKDATQIRGIHQGMILFEQSSKGRYPQPSALDVAGDTVGGAAETKDTTSNIYSYLVFQGFFAPEWLISQVETNDKIGAHTQYAYSEPAKAINPKKALWDPSFSADFTGAGKGHASYAHAMPWMGRLETQWKSQFQSTHAVVSNRGPEIKNVIYNEENTQATMTLANPNSLTLHFFDAAEDPRKEGDPVLWRGHVAFGDNAVRFISSKYGQGQVVTEKDVGLFRFSEERKRPDLAFYNEDPNPKEDNQFLGIFVTAGKARSDWKSIWD